jgi:hypothetical protein
MKRATTVNLSAAQAAFIAERGSTMSIFMSSTVFG